MKDVPCPEQAGRSGHRVARAAALRIAAPSLFHHGGTRRTGDGAVDAASARQAGVGRVHDGIGVLLGEVTLDENDLGWSEMNPHRLPLCSPEARLGFLC